MTRNFDFAPTMGLNELLYHQAICAALDEALEEINDPSIHLLDEEEFWAEDEGK